MWLNDERVSSWIEWVRENSCTGDLLPPVLSAESGPWSQSLEEIWRDDSLEELSQTLTNVIADRPNDLSARFAILKVLRDLILFLYRLEVPEDRQTYLRDFRSGLEEKLKSFVRLIDPKDCSEWRHIRWEISNAYLVEDWELAEILFRRAKELNTVSGAEWYALHGQFLFYSIFHASVSNLFYAYEVDYGDETVTRPDLLQLLVDLDVHSFCDAHMEAVLKNMLVSWDDRPIGMGLPMVYCIFPAERSLDLNIPNDVLDGDDPHRREFAEQRRQRVEKARSQLLECVGDLAAAVERVRGLDVVYQLMIAKCWFELSHFDKAAEYYERSLALMDESESELSIYWTYRAVADCHLRRNAADDALKWLQKASEKFPKRPDIFHKIAEMLALQGAYHDAYENLRRAKELDSSIGEDWRTSTILALGAVPDISQFQDKWLHEFRRAHPGVVQMAEGLLIQLWPTSNKIDEKTKKAFVGGLILQNIEDQPLPAEDRKSLAAFKFAQAVEFELKAKVFEGFRNELQTSNELQGFLVLRATNNAGEKLRACLLNRPVTFGELLNILLASSHTNDPLLRKLNGSVRSRFPRLLPSLSNLFRLNTAARRPAVHEGEITVDISEIQSLTRQCLDVLF